MDRAAFIRNLWRWKCGLPEQDEAPPSIESLRESEWSPSFERLMRNRLVLGAFRYGLRKAQFKPDYDRCAAMLQRLCDYQHTGNLEHLVDIANLAMLEFDESRHPDCHFDASDDAPHVHLVDGRPRLGLAAFVVPKEIAIATIAREVR